MSEGAQKNGCRYALGIVAVVMAVLLGTVGGAIAGGFAGYTVANYRTPAPATVPQVAEAPAPTYLTLTQESAMISAVEKVKPAVVTVINTLPPQRGFFGQIL
ncbi:MAG: hypothetical protein OEV76_06370, partial [Anaerolineae bacterium]|nr:hypothetical protein [Anaerolineae bacterium]